MIEDYFGSEFDAFANQFDVTLCSCSVVERSGVTKLSVWAAVGGRECVCAMFMFTYHP